MSAIETKKYNRDINIRQLAREMKVAICTVSRALSGEPGVSKERAEKIRQKAWSMGYRPQPLRRKRTNAIVVLNVTDQPDVSEDIYVQNVILNVERKASEFRKHVHVEFIPRPAQEKIWPVLLSENRVDGVFLVGYIESDYFRNRLREEKIPAVAIDASIEKAGCSCVNTDFMPATREAVKRLISVGHRQIGFVLTERDFPTVEARYQAYVQALREAGIEPDRRWVIEKVEANMVGGREAIRRYLANQALPTALLFINDWMALGAMNELHQKGYRVPQDISLVGYDNVSICEQLNPKLTSVDGHIGQVVSQAVELLMKQIEGEVEPVEKEVPGTLVWRESCGEPKRK